MQTTTENELKLDIEAVLQNKAPNTKVPRLAINFLKKIIHQDEINLFLKKNSEAKNMNFIKAALDYLQVNVSIENKEKLPPKNGKYIFAGNHPLGGLDGMATGYLVGLNYDGKIQFLSNDLLMNVTPLHEMFVPVNKVGSQSKSNADSMKRLYESDNHLVIFPAGMCSRKIDGKIIDLEWKKNFIKKSIEFQRDVIPVYFEGRNSNFFYRLANIRKALKIKLNIEMMFLADEMFKQKGKKFLLRIGDPIPWQTFDKTKSAHEWAQWVKEKVYQMQ